METREAILSVAQRLVQQRGFNGFSYADVASEVGIRKASLHHHFPTKTDLGLALIEDYSNQFDALLAGIDASVTRADQKLRAFADLYRSTLKSDRICLCGMMGSEAATLDTSVLPKLRRYFSLSTEWLAEALATGKTQNSLNFNGPAADHARMFLSALQGALLIARATGDHAAFNQTSALLIAGFTRNG